MNLLLDPAGLFNCLPIVTIAVRDQTRPADCIDGSHTLEAIDGSVCVSSRAY